MKRRLKLPLLSSLTLLILLPFLMGAALPVMALEPGATLLMPDLSVVPGGEAGSRVTVENTDGKAHVWQISITGLSDGYQASCLLEGKAVEKIEEKATEKKVLEIRLSSPANASTTDGAFRLSLLREDGQETIMPLSFSMDRTYSLETVPSANRIEVMNGKGVGFDVSVVNTGSKDLTKVGLQVELPYKWVLEKITPVETTLKSGESGLFHVRLSVPVTQASGNFTLKVIGTSNEVTGSVTAIPVQVAASAGYAIWILGMLLLVAVLTFLFFRKHGRR